MDKLIYDILNEAEKIAVNRYESGEKHSTSCFIDDDTIIAGYGELDYDFEFQLPTIIIKDIYGTTSWSEYFKNKGLNRYKTISDKGVVSITPYLNKEEIENLKNDNPNYQIIEL